MGRVIRQSAVEYFKGLVEDALTHQRVDASPLASFYLVNLLAGFVDPNAGRLTGEPLGVRLVQALQAAGAARRQRLREVGDWSLFLTGFFADSLYRRAVNLDYFIALGGRAYGELRESDDGLAPVFGELAEHFVDFVDVLAEVSEETGFSAVDDADLLRLYEKWLRTRSRRDGEILARRGIPPNPSLIGRLEQ